MKSNSSTRTRWTLELNLTVRCQWKYSTFIQGKTVSIIWAGDFNANVTSLSCQLLVNGRMVSDKSHRSYNEGSFWRRNVSVRRLCLLVEEYALLVEDFEYQSPLELNTYSNYRYTHYVVNFHEVIDHFFFDKKSLSFERSIPMPAHEEVIETGGLPSYKQPSDHLAVVQELKFNWFDRFVFNSLRLLFVLFFNWIVVLFFDQRSIISSILLHHQIKLALENRVLSSTEFVNILNSSTEFFQFANFSANFRFCSSER